MQVILIQDVDNLGGVKELVTVKNGYARNFLIPQKFAVEANPSNLKQLEERQKVRRKKEAKMLAEINHVMDVLKESPLKIGAKTGTSGKIFGSVTALQISRASLSPRQCAGRSHSADPLRESVFLPASVESERCVCS